MGFQDLVPQVAKLATGVELNYVRAGTGPVMILIHGAMGDYRSWAPQWPALSASYDCISYSRRYSFPNPNVLDSRDHSALVEAGDVLALMDVLGISRAVLVGSSYGGFTALATALRAPDRVRAVVSVEAPMMRYAYMTTEDATIAQDFRDRVALPAREAFARGDDVAGTQILTGGIVGRKATDLPPAVLERRMQNAQAARSLALSDDEFPLLDPEALGALPMPVLLMSGEQTAPVHAAIFRNVSRAMPQARVRIVPDAGHSVSQAQPDVFNREVQAFLRAHDVMPGQETV